MNLDNLNLETWHLVVIAVISGAIAGGFVDVMLGHRYAWLIGAAIWVGAALIGEYFLRRRHPPNGKGEGRR